MLDATTLQGMGLSGLFLATLLSSTFIPAVGIPLIAFLIYQKYNLITIIIIATMGNWIGAVASFYLGYYCKWDWLEKYFKIKRTHLESVQNYIEKYHSMSALLTGFPAIGDRISIALGVFKTKKIKTFIYMFFGKLIRYVALVSLLQAGIL